MKTVASGGKPAITDAQCLLHELQATNLVTVERPATGAVDRS